MAAPIAAAKEATKTKEPGPPLWLSILVFLVGAALIAVGGATIVSRVLESQTVDSFAVPGQQSRQLDPGSHDVFGSTGNITDFSGAPEFFSEDVTITNVETGASVTVTPDLERLPIDRLTTRYERVGTFEISEAGEYVFEVTPPAGATESRAVVARSLLESFSELQTPLILIGVGTVATLIGVVMIVVGIVRRGRAKRAERGHGATPGIYQAPPPQHSPPPQNSAPPLSPSPPPAPPTDPPPAGGPDRGETNTPW